MEEAINRIEKEFNNINSNLAAGNMNMHEVGMSCGLEVALTILKSYKK